MFLVNVQLLEAFTNQPLRIRGIVDDKILRIRPQIFNLHAKEAGTERMERTQPDVVCGISNQRIYTVTHFACRLIRKGDGKNAVRRNAMLQQISNAEGQYACLPGTRARHDEKRTIDAGYSSLLRLVQPLKQIHENSFYL